MAGGSWSISTKMDRIRCRKAKRHIVNNVETMSCDAYQRANWSTISHKYRAMKAFSK